MLAKAHSSSTRLGAARIVALAIMAGAFALSSMLVISAQASAADPVTGRLATLAATTTHELSTTVDAVATEATANAVPAAAPETAAEPEAPMQQVGTSDPNPASAATSVERGVQRIVNAAPETTDRGGSPPSAAIGAQGGAQAGVHALATAGAVHVASAVTHVTGELRRTGRSGLEAVAAPAGHVLAHLAPTTRVVQALSSDRTTLVDAPTGETLAHVAVHGLTSMTRTALTPAGSIGRATTSALSFPLLSAPAPSSVGAAELPAGREAFTATDLLSSNDTALTRRSVNVGGRTTLTLTSPSAGLLRAGLQPYGGRTMEHGRAALSPLTTPPPARGPTPEGVSGATAAGPGAGASVSIFLALAGLLMLALPRALRRIRLASAPWRVAPFALIPARPG